MRPVTAEGRRLPAVIVCGPPASGKSTVGRALAARLGAALLDQDVLTSPLTAVVSTLLRDDDLDSPVLAGATRSARYETIIAAAEDNLRTGRPVVMVAPFSVERRDLATWMRLTGRLGDAGATATLVWLRIPDEELLGRMRARAAPRDRGKLVDGAAYLARTDLAPPVVPHVPIDATTSLTAQCAAVIAAIS